MQRRQFIQLGLSAAAAAAVQSSAVFAAERKIPFALQINSVAAEARKDFAAAMKRTAALGFKGVEFAGYYGKTPEFLKAVLDDCGLAVVGTHLGIDSLIGDKFDATVDFNKRLGNAHLVIGHGLGKANSTDAGNRMAANLVNELARKAETVGMFVAYHCHPDDFTPVNKETAWDLFFSRTDERVLMQMDTANSIQAGADPYKSMARFASRNKIVHLKASGPDGSTVRGKDDRVDWPRVFKFCEDTARSQWYILEQYPVKGEDAFAAVEESVRQFKKMGQMQA